MKGIILAAGRGSRMKAATADKPKCLTVLAGKPLLQWQLESLHKAGIGEIAVVCGYKAEAIATATLPVPFQQIINPHWAITNMVSSLLCAREWNGGRSCIISYSDIVYSHDHVEKLMQSQLPVGITYDTQWRSLWELRFADLLSDAETFREENGRLLAIGEKAQWIEEIQGQYMGLIKLDPAGWDAVGQVCMQLGNATAKIDMTTLIRKLLKKDVPVAAVPVDGKWCEVDSESDMALYEKALQISPWPHDWREHTEIL